LLLVAPVIFLYVAFFIDCFANFFKNKKASIRLFIFVRVVFDFATVKSYSFSSKSFYSLEKYTPQPGFKEVYNQLNNIIDYNDLVFTPYPSMSVLYLKKGETVSIVISYTSRENQGTQIGDKEYYTGINSYSFKNKKEIRKTIKS